MWKNKHVVVAMLVAPVLAILAWFAVDNLVGEKPHAARAGADYPLVAKSNCRYESGSCDLENAEFRLTLTGTPGGDQGLRLSVVSKHRLVALSAGLAPSPGEPALPVPLAPEDESGLAWSGSLGASATEGAAIQLVATAGESRYFAEVPTVWLEAAQPE